MPVPRSQKGFQAFLTSSERMSEGKAKAAVELGNAKALDVGKGGPATGRTVYPSGSQHGLKDNPMKQGHDILNDYGPNAPGKRQ